MFESGESDVEEEAKLETIPNPQCEIKMQKQNEVLDREPSYRYSADHGHETNGGNEEERSKFVSLHKQHISHFEFLLETFDRVMLSDQRAANDIRDALLLPLEPQDIKILQEVYKRCDIVYREPKGLIEFKKVVKPQHYGPSMRRIMNQLKASGYLRHYNFFVGNIFSNLDDDWPLVIMKLIEPLENPQIFRDLFMQINATFGEINGIRSMSDNQKEAALQMIYRNFFYNHVFVIDD